MAAHIGGILFVLALLSLAGVGVWGAVKSVKRIAEYRSDGSHWFWPWFAAGEMIFGIGISLSSLWYLTHVLGWL